MVLDLLVPRFSSASVAPTCSDTISHYRVWRLSTLRSMASCSTNKVFIFLVHIQHVRGSLQSEAWGMMVVVSVAPLLEAPLWQHRPRRCRYLLQAAIGMQTVPWAQHLSLIASKSRVIPVVLCLWLYYKTWLLIWWLCLNLPQAMWWTWLLF